MRLRRVGAVLFAGALALTACGDDGDDPTIDVPDGVTDPTSSGAGDSTTTTVVAEGDPTEAAEAFYADVLGAAAAPDFADFQQGDASSGEVPVVRSGGQTATTLLLRNVDGEWAVTGATSDGVVLDAPENASTVAAGPIEVTGSGRGFEGTVIVKAIPFGGGAALAETFVTAGSMEALEPFSATLDLSAAAPGDQVYVVAYNDSAEDGSIVELAAVLVTIG